MRFDQQLSGHSHAVSSNCINSNISQFHSSHGGQPYKFIDSLIILTGISPVQPHMGNVARMVHANCKKKNMDFSFYPFSVLFQILHLTLNCQII